MRVGVGQVSAPTRPVSYQKVQRTFASHPLGSLQVSGERVTTPSEQDLTLVASSGSPVSVSLQPWSIMVDVVMTCLTKRNALAFAGYHDFHPQRHLPFALLVQVSELSDVMHLYPFLGSTYFTCVIQ